MRVGLEGKRALVTGAASGIGRAIAEAYAAEGATVAVHARSEERVAETLESIANAGGKAFAALADLTDPAAIEGMCKAAIERLGGLDVVVNNAGVADYAKVVDMDEAMWDWIMAVNLKAPYLVSKHTLPAMIEQGSGGSAALQRVNQCQDRGCGVDRLQHHQARPGRLRALPRRRGGRAQHPGQRHLPRVGRDQDGGGAARKHGARISTSPMRRSTTRACAPT